ncbi:neuronal acetylcholine receptor subunit alpha-7-like [Ptychodera flava]|uniref:neuronal acetylcholine receptor subunit alpha-7-like n=1 Tax=Ptychodera flava TaxID=63121 RepID=UPI00396A81C4
MVDSRTFKYLGKTLPIFISVVASLYAGVSGSLVYRQLVRGLLDDYDKLVRPVYNHSQATGVNMIFYVSQILDLSEREQHLQLNAWVTLIWKDEYLRWNSSEYGDIKGVKFPASHIWIPQIVLYQNADDQYRDFLSKEIVKVSDIGEVMWAAPVVFMSYCTVDTYYFPFDEQKCQLKFGPWQYDGLEVTLDGGGDVSVYTGNGEWDMLDMSSESHVEYYPDDPGVPYTDVTYTLHLKRRPVFYVFTLLLPCLLLCGVTVVDFLLPTESGEKVSLAITILLSMTVFLLLFAESMPATDVIPLIGQFYAATVLLVTFSLVTSVIVSSYHFAGSERGLMSARVKRLAFAYLGPIVGISQYDDSKFAEAPSRVQPTGITLVNYTRKDSLENIQFTDSHKMNGMKESEVKVNCSTDRGKGDPLLTHLRQKVDKLTSFHEQKSLEDHLKKEWRHFAMIMDRYFMIVYILGFIGTLLMVICQF